MGDEMNGAELLREAARLMRKRAEAATPGRWQALMDGYGDTSRGRAEDDRRDLMWVRSGYTNHGDIATTYGCPDSTLIHDNVSHIASWHPAVALAVANWLAYIANLWDENARLWNIDRGEKFGRWNEPTEHQALTVARAYLSAPVSAGEPAQEARDEQ